jgi:steroid delta-isomerase-like uncharacterized protein
MAQSLGKVAERFPKRSSAILACAIEEPIPPEAAMREVGTMRTTTTEVEKKELVARWPDEVLNQRRIDVIDELVDEEVVWRMPFSPEPLRGREAMKEVVAAFLAGFSDFAVDVETVVAEGDRVALAYTAHGTNDGELLGAPPTGRRADFRAIHVFTLREGKIIADVTVADRLRLMEQLGRA